MTDEVWHLWESGSADGAWNMAADEALLNWVSELGRPVLRFYSWTESAASFGYFQHYSRVEHMTRLRPLIRRPTGGGLVPHDSDWTYSLAFPRSHAWYALRAEFSYRKLHEWLQASFATLGAITELAPSSAKEAPGQCFAGPEKFDLVWEAHKIAGAAQRRTKSGLLIQGSVQRQPTGVRRAEWEASFAQRATDQWQLRWDPYPESDRFKAQVDALVQTRYSQAAFHQKR